MKCSHCGAALTRQPRVTQVTGWVRDRKAGGVNQVRAATPTSKALCDSCGVHFWTTGRLPSLIPEGQMELSSAS